MNVALVHDWLTGMRGGERVLEALLEMFPDAEIHTLLHVQGSVSERLENRPIHTSFLQRVPDIGTRYRYFLPIMPRAVESLDVSGADLVVSSSHCVAKGVRVPTGVPHVCYCHTPMRYVWDQQEAYFGRGRASVPVRLMMRGLAPRLRAWDIRTASRVQSWVANSSFVRERIRTAYGRDAAVVHPPVDVDRFKPGKKEDFYLTLGAPAPYKRVDLAVEVMRKMGRRLLVVGGGVGKGAAGRLRNSVGTDGSVTWLGHLPDTRVADLLGRARALVLPGVEDFGITAVEALASGTPIIALGRGGVVDTVESPMTGVFFDEPTAGSLEDAVLRFETLTFDTHVLVSAALPFRRERFLDEMRAEIERALAPA